MLWGVGQLGARLLGVVSGARISAIRLNLITGILLPLCFLTGLAGSITPVATAFFVLGYGAVNGLNTIVKAVLPLVLFDPQQYARKTGILLSPAFFSRHWLRLRMPYCWSATVYPARCFFLHPDPDHYGDFCGPLAASFWLCCAEPGPWSIYPSRKMFDGFHISIILEI